MSKTIRIGTRDSRLALWQAEYVARNLRQIGIHSDIIPVKSEGDLNLATPLYEMGIQGIFTKTLDIALLEGRIDIAVHSYKDVPTSLPAGLVIAAVPERGVFTDILVTCEKIDSKTFFTQKKIIATGSIRRKAQWLHQYPHHEIVPLRGNVMTRLQKLNDQGWDGAIFAKAGLKRLEINGYHQHELSFLPAPGQGALAVVARDHDREIIDTLQPLHHQDTALCVSLEKTFLKTLEGGCSAPIACLAVSNEESISFQGELYDPEDMAKKYSISATLPKSANLKEKIREMALQLLERKKKNKTDFS